MERRDLIQDEIEQLGRVLGKMLAMLLGLKSRGKVNEGISVVQQELMTQLDIDINQLLKLSGDELTAYLKQWNLTSEHLETLSAILLESGRDEVVHCDPEAVLRLQRSAELLDIADVISKTASFERMAKRSEIENLLSKCM